MEGIVSSGDSSVHHRRADRRLPGKNPSRLTGLENTRSIFKPRFIQRERDKSFKGNSGKFVDEGADCSFQLCPVNRRRQHVSMRFSDIVKYCDIYTFIYPLVLWGFSIFFRLGWRDIQMDVEVFHFSEEKSHAFKLFFFFKEIRPNYFSLSLTYIIS